MKKIKTFFNLILVLLLLAGCGTQYLGGDRDTKWQKDLSYLKEAIKNKDPYVYDNISEEEFNSKLKNLKEEVPNLSDNEVVNKIYEIMATVGDAHTKAQKKFTKKVPLVFSYFQDGFYLINTIDQYKEGLYCKLKKVNNMDIKEVEKKLEPLISHENKENVIKTLPNFFVNPEILEGVKIVDNIDTVKFTLEDSNGKEFNLEVETIDTKNVSEEDKDKYQFIYQDYDETYPLYMQQGTLNYWYKYLEDNKVLYLKYKVCEEDKESGSIDKIIDEMIELIDEGKVDKFVMDVRENSGGSTHKFDRLVDKIRQCDLNKRDKFFVIIGRPTFSAAVEDTSNIRESTNATIVGQPTSMRPNHYGEVTKFELPNSKIMIYCSTKHITIHEDNGDSLIPDKIIETSINDYVEKRDPVMEYIINFSD